MNRDRILGNWKQFKGSANVQWGRLTEDRLKVVAGQRGQLAGRMQEACGLAAEATQEQIERWKAQKENQAKPHDLRDRS